MAKVPLLKELSEYMAPRGILCRELA